VKDCKDYVKGLTTSADGASHRWRGGDMNHSGWIRKLTVMLSTNSKKSSDECHRYAAGLQKRNEDDS